MAVAKKPKIAKGKSNGVDIDALINKGGTPAIVTKKNSEDKPILIRIPSNALEKIDEIVSSKQIKTPRHTWLLEAVFEKLEREI